MKNTFTTLFTIQSKNKKLLYVSFTILGILFYGCAKRDDMIFDNGLKFFNEGKYINAHKELSKVQMELQYYDTTR